MRQGVSLLLACHAIIVPVTAQNGPDVTALVGGRAGGAVELSVPVKVILGERHLILLNRAAPFLQVFDWNGRPVQRLGRAGQGPGEFRSPYTMAADTAAGRLYVIDSQNGRITIYAIGDTLSLLGSDRLPIPMVQNACANGGRLLVVGDAGGKLVHELGRVGEGWEIARSFGLPQSRHRMAKHPLMRLYMSEGPMLCGRDGQRIYVGSRLLGDVQWLESGGGRQEWLETGPFSPIDLRATPDGLLVLSLPPSGLYQEIARLLEDDAGVLAVIGVVDGDHRGMGDYRSTEVRRLAGRQETRSQTYDLLGWHRGKAVCFASDPDPVIGVSNGHWCP